MSKMYLNEGFTDSFDFIGDKLSKSLILDILTEYEEIWADEPDDPNLPFDCESMLTLLGDHHKAVACLERIRGQYGTGMRMLRLAFHYAGMHDEKRAYEMLCALCADPRNEHEKECAFIAAGRCGDRQAAVRLWNELLWERGLASQRITDEVLANPYSFNCLSHLHMREWDEGVRLLYHYDIRENRDVELCALVSMIHYQMGMIYNSLIDMIQNVGPYEAFSGMVVALAIASGASSLIAQYRDMVVVDQPRVYQELILNLEGVRKFQTFFAIAERLLTISAPNFEPSEAFLHKMIRDTEGDMYQLCTALELFTRSGSDADYERLLEMVLRMDPDIGRKMLIRREMEQFLGPRPPLDYI